jgi:hypothetical protein
MGCKTASSITTATSNKEQIQVAINLIDIKEDKVMVTVKAPSFNTDEITYHIPKQFLTPRTITVNLSTV